MSWKNRKKNSFHCIQYLKENKIYGDCKLAKVVLIKKTKELIGKYYFLAQ